MLHGLVCACEGSNCDQRLRDEQLMLVMKTTAGERRAYECECGTVTVTVVRPGE